ncbi:hypothetical protein N7509_001523 [Penicillium cosmopolitanum]|uniref:Protein kinase domain-containing protein n=1 Tax=Penicillium cosmopolitanum TaxID=1131564 RepID=A0A9X0BCJ9_9EURO|nr:uncharacterized protein N7509_001523 [Penicillium cosmopolitanum]KAJ5407640.1 hypothetical protein N7509_001523 [Penicillium cosmopolitanum]
MIQEDGEIDLKDVEILELLKKSEYSAIFKYHNQPYREWDPPDREVNFYVCESTAYRRLKAKGFCERKVIPDFYGTITNIQPRQWPHLWMFVDDELPPTAIVIEYVPNMHRIDLTNFSPQNVQILRDILEDIHLAGVLHDDTYPRNMMISRDPSTKQVRVLWIDFDRAQTFSESLSEWQKEQLEEETEIMDEFIQLLTQDNEQGELYHAYAFYYGVFGPLGWAMDYEWIQEKYAIPEPPPGPSWEEFQRVAKEQESQWKIVGENTREVTVEWDS